MKKNIASLLIFCLATTLSNAEDPGRTGEFSYEVIGLDEASYPRYDGGWAPGSGHEVEFSGWTQVSKGKRMVEKDESLFSLKTFSEGRFPLRMAGGRLDKTRAFTVVSEEGESSFAQRKINQAIGPEDMVSASILFGDHSDSAKSEAGMVFGKKGDGGNYLAAVTLLQSQNQYLLVDGEGVAKIKDLSTGEPLGVSFVFEDNGTYTLQINEMKPEGKIIDIGPRKTTVGGGRGDYSLAFFSTGKSWISFDDLQIERLVK